MFLQSDRPLTTADGQQQFWGSRFQTFWISNYNSQIKMQS